MTRVDLAREAEQWGLVQYLERLVALDNRAAVRLQAGGPVIGVWSGPPFEVVALRPVGWLLPAQCDADRLGAASARAGA